MFSKVFAAAALGVVAASDVTLFSSNDDYDEINLNIRMLSNSTTVHSVSAKAKIKATFSSGTTAETLNSNDAFKDGFCNTAKGYLPDAKICTVSSVTAATLRARARMLTELTVTVAYALTFTSATSADSAKTALDSTATGAGSFADYFNTNLATNIQAQDQTFVISGITAESQGAQTCTVGNCGATAPGTGGSGGAAAPSPSPSSNAFKVGMSALAAVAAFMATML